MWKRWLKIQIVFRRERSVFVLPPLFVLKGHGVRLNFGGFYLLDEHNLGPKNQ